MCIVNSQRPRVGLMTNWQLGEGGGGVSKRVTADPYSPHSPPPFPPPHRHLENVVHIWHSKRWRRGRGGQEISLFNACGVGARNQAFPRRVSSPLFLYRRNKEVWAEGGGQRGGKESWCVVSMYNCIYIYQLYNVQYIWWMQAIAFPAAGRKDPHTGKEREKMMYVCSKVLKRGAKRTLELKRKEHRTMNIYTWDR